MKTELFDDLIKTEILEDSGEVSGKCVVPTEGSKIMENKTALPEKITGTFISEFEGYIQQNEDNRLSLFRSENDWRGVVRIDGVMRWEWGPTKEQALAWMHSQVPQNIQIVSDQ